jgi:fatty-acyl-CoA synthase
MIVKLILTEGVTYSHCVPTILQMIVDNMPEGFKLPDEKTKELWAGGWLHTGDIAVMDEESYITIVDRLKDVIKSRGEWISPLTLENLLSLNPKVREAAVLGIPDEKWGERPLAIVVPMPGVQLTAEELRQHLMKYAEQGVITKWAVPEKYVFVDELPKTSVGKIDKKVLMQKFR